MAPRDRLHRPARAMLESLVPPSSPPRVADRTLDGDRVRPASRAPPPRRDAVDVTYWTPVGRDHGPGDERSDAPGGSTADSADGPPATVLSDPPLPGDVGEVITHTLVLGVDDPVISVRIDHGTLGVAVASSHGTRVTTEDGRPIEGVVTTVASDGAVVATFTEPPTDGPLLVEYGVTHNPAAGRHRIDVVVNGEVRTEAGLVLLG